MTVVAIITDDEMYEERTVLFADTIAEVAACFGSYLAATAAPCTPPPPVKADPAGWEAWLAAFIDDDGDCPVDIAVYAPEQVLTPRHVLAHQATTTREWREFIARAAPALRLSRNFDACARVVEDVTATL